MLLLVSADYIASDYLYEVEMKKALGAGARRKGGLVFPVLLHACATGRSRRSRGSSPSLPARNR